MIWVKFPVVATIDGPVFKGEQSPDRGKLVDAKVVIWTTTPWTIPANRAISLRPQRSPTASTASKRWSPPPRRLGARRPNPAELLIVADASWHEEVFRAQPRSRHGRGWRRWTPPASSAPIRWRASVTRSMRTFASVPLLAGDHVTDDAGTGFVHTAPGHGVDDYLVWLGSRSSARSRKPWTPTAPTYDSVAAVRRAAGDRGRGQEGRQVRTRPTAR